MKKTILFLFLSCCLFSACKSEDDDATVLSEYMHNFDEFDREAVSI
ncbi:hypothetical protein [Viscerimonas tarda]